LVDILTVSINKIILVNAQQARAVYDKKDKLKTLQGQPIYGV